MSDRTTIHREMAARVLPGSVLMSRGNTHGYCYRGQAAQKLVHVCEVPRFDARTLRIAAVADIHSCEHFGVRNHLSPGPRQCVKETCGFPVALQNCLARLALVFAHARSYGSRRVDGRLRPREPTTAHTTES